MRTNVTVLLLAGILNVRAFCQPHLPSQAQEIDSQKLSWGAQPEGAGTSTAERSSIYPWENLEQLRPGDRVAVYLLNGGRMVQKFRGFNDSELRLDIDGVSRDQILAVVPAPADQLTNGVLIGSAIGFASVLVGAMAHDANPEAAALGAVLSGLPAGAGIGALVDGGLARPQKPPLYLRGETGNPDWKRWKMEVPPSQIANWVFDKKIELMLRDGTYVKGKVTGGDDRRLLVSVDQSSDKSLEVRNAALATREISTIILREHLGGNPVAAGFGGGLLGFFTGFYLGAVANENARTALGPVLGAGLGTLAGSSAALGFAGHRNWREITLVVKE